MKRILFVITLAIFIVACSTSKKTVNQSDYKTLVGQNEMLVLKQMGTPTQIIQNKYGGKVMIYENHYKGSFLTPNKSNFSVNDAGWTYTSNVNKKTNDSNYTINSKAYSTVWIYIDENGKCVAVEQTPPGEYGEVYHERFKHFNTR